MVALAIRVGSKTNAILSRSRRFSINWLNYTKEKEKDPILRLSLPQKNPGPDKLGALGIPYELVAGTPVLAQAQAFTLSYVTKKLRTGDHDLFIAKTLLVKASSDFTKDKYWRFKKYKPALYLGSIRKNPMMTISPRKIKH
jgi:flavin reductase (DIM6/NTAB) family NADH-FMN oxidoreductase RutF